MERLTDAEIAGLERLEKAATPGPWCEDPEGAPPWFIMAGDPSIDVPCVGEINTTADMEFIINARRLVPRLLAELRERRAADDRTPFYQCGHCGGFYQLGEHCHDCGRCQVCCDCGAKP